MKILSLFLFVSYFGVICFSTKVFAQTNSSHSKWTAESFNSLSQSDKKKFIQELREVIVLFDGKSDFFAEQLNLKAGTFTNLAQLVLLQQCASAAMPTEETYLAQSKEKLKFYKTDSYIEASSMALKEFKELVKNNNGQELDEDQGQMANSAVVLLVAEAKRLENSSDTKSKKDLENKFNELMKQLSTYKVPNSTRRTMNGVEAVFYKINKINKSEEAVVSNAKVQEKKETTEKNLLSQKH